MIDLCVVVAVVVVVSVLALCLFVVVSMLFALRALRRVRRLRRQPIGVLYYGDEGSDCRYSAEILQQAMSRAKNVLVLRPGNVGDYMVTGRRGQRRYRVRSEGEPLRLGKANKRPSSPATTT